MVHTRAPPLCTELQGGVSDDAIFKTQMVGTAKSFERGRVTSLGSQASCSAFLDFSPSGK
jgi:hypothetical protein